VVDDFGIKYTNRCDADHLLTVLQQFHTFTTDWTGLLYTVMHMAWDYINHTVDISMPGYVAKALDRFQHHALRRPQHPPRMKETPVRRASTSDTGTRLFFNTHTTDASDMCLHIHSAASYLSEANARSRAGGTFFLRSNPIDTTKPTSTANPPPPYNSAIHTISAIMANVVASAT
jgi:hypothetical protein